MSFSTDVKKELSQINNLANKEEVKYELLGYLLSDNCTIEKKTLKYSTENEYNINRFAKLLRNVNIDDFNIEIQGKIFIITVKKADGLLQNFETDLEDIQKLEKIRELHRIIIRGVFLGSGSVNNPESQYHLEFNLRNIEYVPILIKILEENDVKVKNIEKSIYVKDGEEISKFLALIGAGKSVIKFEEIRVQRYMNNKVNRLVNCKTANLNKTINASVEQINAINKLKEKGQFSKLDDSLKEIAELRLMHPDMSMIELGKLLKNPIGKSGVNYRLKKIQEISENI